METAAQGDTPPTRKTPLTCDADGTFAKPQRTPTHTLFQSNVSPRTKTDKKITFLPVTSQRGRNAPFFKHASDPHSHDGINAQFLGNSMCCKKSYDKKTDFWFISVFKLLMI
jgi:hypothetical protein